MSTPGQLPVSGDVCVRHPEQVLIAEGKTTLIVVDSQDHAHIMDVDQISKLRLLSRLGSKGTDAKVGRAA